MPVEAEDVDEVYLALWQAKAAFIANGYAPSPNPNNQSPYALYLVNRAIEVYRNRRNRGALRKG